MVIIEPDSVYQISYLCEAQNEASGVWNVEFAVVTGLEQVRCERLFFECRVPHGVTEHWQPGVSGTFDASYGRSGRSTADRAMELLERNLSDLITMYVTNSARRDRSITIVLGPPLPGLVGRLAYRCLNRNAIVAFLTWMSPICTGPRFKAEGNVNSLLAKWCGPFPALHEDSLTRAFYNYSREGSGTMSVRLDLMCQSLGAGNLSEDVFSSLISKLEALDQIIGSKGAFRFPAGRAAYLPHELARLSLSLRWTDRKFKALLKDNERQLSEAAGADRVAALARDGVTSIEPIDALAARFGSTDQNYIRERLFESLERRVAALGMIQGTIEFLGQKEVPL
jgi:hypothetical protein